MLIAVVLELDRVVTRAHRELEDAFRLLHDGKSSYYMTARVPIERQLSKMGFPAITTYGGMASPLNCTA